MPGGVRGKSLALPVDGLGVDSGGESDKAGGDTIPGGPLDPNKGFISLTEKESLNLQALAAGLVADPAGEVAERFKGPVVAGAAGVCAILVASARTVIHCEVPATK